MEIYVGFLAHFSDFVPRRSDEFGMFHNASHRLTDSLKYISFIGSSRDQNYPLSTRGEGWGEVIKTPECRDETLGRRRLGIIDETDTIFFFVKFESVGKGKYISEIGFYPFRTDFQLTENQCGR